MIVDEIDIKILDNINQNPGQPKADAIKPILGERSRTRLYARLKHLEKDGLIEVNRTKARGLALVTITTNGKAAIRGREEPCPKAGASS